MHLEYLNKAAKGRLTLHCFPLVTLIFTSVSFFTFAIRQLFEDIAVIRIICLKTLNLLSVCTERFCFML